MLWRIKAPLLASSMLTVMAGAAVAPALGRVSVAFPDVDITVIKLILTMPALFTIVSTFFIVGTLAERFGKRPVLIGGIILYIIGGASAGLAGNIATILIFRALLGLSVGIVMPLTNGMIADFFTGPERMAMMGKASAFANLGGIVATGLSGVLAMVSWRLAFAIYLVGVFALLFIIAFLPEPDTGTSGRRLPTGLPLAPWLAGLAFFAVFVVFYSIPTGLAIYMESAGIGTAGSAGLCLAIMTGTAFVSGLSLGTYRKLIGNFLLPFLFLLMTTGFYLLASASNLAAVFAAAVVFGFGFGGLVPVLYVAAASKVEQSRNVAAMSLATGFVFLGQFLSPPILDALSDLFGDGSIGFTYRMNMYIFAIPLAVATACAVRSTVGRFATVCGIGGAASKEKDTD